MPQQRLHGLHFVSVRYQQGAECMPEHMSSKVFGDFRPLGRRSNVAFHQRIRPVRLAPFTSRAGEHHNLHPWRTWYPPANSEGRRL